MVRKAETRLWLTSDGRVVAEGDPDARTLWKAEGDDITADEDKRYKLGGTQPRNAEAASEFDDGSDIPTSDEGEKSEPASEDKAADQGGNKSRGRAADKSA